MSVGRLVRAADFEKVLQTPVVARSEHFALHHVPTRPSAPVDRKLSTGDAPKAANSVDDLPPAPSGCWLGMVVPKRHARPSVMRTLVKRQIRAVMGDHAARLPAGLWVVRLRAPFDRRRFVSAASQALREAARSELVGAFESAARGSAR